MIEVLDERQGVVAFAGCVLASASSKSVSGRQARRWSEIAIYRRSSGGFVVHEVGRSNVSGEVDRHRVRHAATGRAAFDAVAQQRRFTALDTEVFNAAAFADAEFAATLGDAPDVEDLHSVGVSALIVGADVSEITLDRDGDRALRFRGHELARARSGEGDSRPWTEVAIFRVVDGRFVAQKAQYANATDAPTRSTVHVVSDAAAAAQALVRTNAAWIETAVLSALRQAARADAAFAAVAGDDGILTAALIRAITGARRVLTATERAVLGALARGSALVAVSDADGPARVLRWLPAGERAALPHGRVFVALSRDRLIQRGPAAAGIAAGEAAWEISQRGLRALEDGARA